MTQELAALLSSFLQLFILTRDKNHHVIFKNLYMPLLMLQYGQVNGFYNMAVLLPNHLCLP